MRPSITLLDKREQILEIAERYGARNVRVFGSVVRGEDTERSDLDLLVDMDDDRPLSDLAVFAEDVCDVIHCRVQAVTSDGLHRLLKKRILSEARPL
jgi:predicted nucleotidyltransferase